MGQSKVNYSRGESISQKLSKITR